MAEFNSFFFWTRFTHDDGTTLARVLRRVSNIPLNQRNMIVSGHVIRLQDITFGEDFIEGDILKIRMHNLPVRADLDGVIAEFNFTAREGVGERAAFLYNRRYRILQLQQNRHVIGETRLARYLEYHSQIDNTINFEPVLNVNAYERLLGMASVKKLEVSFAHLHTLSGALHAQGHTSLGRVIDFSNQFAPAEATLVLSMGRQHQRSLSPERIFGFARDMMQIRQENDDTIKKLVVTGYVEDEEGEHSRTILDLLSYRLVAPIEYDPAERTLSYESRRGLLRQAWNSTRPEIERMMRMGAGG
ncbi:MAG: DUF6731 family protein [Armatimonadota bacterium]